MKKMLSSLLLGLTLVAVSPVSAMDEAAVEKRVNSNFEALDAAGVKTSFIKKHKVALIALGTVAAAAGTFALLDGYVLAHPKREPVEAVKAVKAVAAKMSEDGKTELAPAIAAVEGVKGVTARAERVRFAMTRKAAGATFDYVINPAWTYAVRPVVFTAPKAVYKKNKAIFTTKGEWLYDANAGKEGEKPEMHFSKKAIAFNSTVIAGDALAIVAAILVGYDLCVKSENQKFIIAFIKHMMGTKKAKNS